MTKAELLAIGRKVLTPPDNADPVIWCAGESDVLELSLSALLPHAFGPADLA